MIEKDIFKVLQEIFNGSALMEDIKLWSFSIEEEAKPFIVFQGESTGENIALIQLIIESDYKGMAEISALKKEMKTLLSGSPLRDESFCYGFKEESLNQKKNILSFRVKRFKIGE
tara:strand:+ start:327 stop:671 length:345 start_codon:yes stop_codon:yes gene_type:complete